MKATTVSLNEFRGQVFASHLENLGLKVDDGRNAVAGEDTATGPNPLQTLGTIVVSSAEKAQVMGEWMVPVEVTVTVNSGEWLTANPTVSAYSFDTEVGMPAELTLDSISIDPQTSAQVQVWKGTVIAQQSPPNLAVGKVTFMDANYEETEKSDVRQIP